MCGWSRNLVIRIKLSIDYLRNSDEALTLIKKLATKLKRRDDKSRDVAEAIADAAGADIFEVVPTEPYTDEDLNWTNNDSRVSREHDDESLRDVELTTTEVPDWDSYDTVLIGA